MINPRQRLHRLGFAIFLDEGLFKDIVRAMKPAFLNELTAYVPYDILKILNSPTGRSVGRGINDQKSKSSNHEYI
jgi:hypothetical protein